MKQIFIFLLILSTMIFIGCTNDITDSSQGDGGNNPDGLASTYDGNWYFYSENGIRKGDTITIADGGITGLKTSSGEAIDFVKDNFKDVLDIKFPTSKNYVVYKDGYTGNINLNTDIAYVKIKDSSKTVVIEGMLSKTQRSTTIGASDVGRYITARAPDTGLVNYTLDAATGLVTFTITPESGTTETYTMPSAYFTKTATSSYTCNALNYPDTVLTLSFDAPKVTINHINVNYSASDANFSEVTSDSTLSNLSSIALLYVKEQQQP